jgi:hypothetical protein
MHVLVAAGSGLKYPIWPGVVNINPINVKRRLVMHCLEVIKWMNTGDNYKKALQNRQFNIYPGKPASANGHNSAVKVFLEASAHPLLAVREVLDTLLLTRDCLPPAVQLALEAARAAVVSASQAE